MMEITISDYTACCNQKSYNFLRITEKTQNSYYYLLPKSEKAYFKNYYFYLMMY